MNFGTLKDDASLRSQLQAAEGVYVISQDMEMFKVGMALKEYEESSRSIYRRLQAFQTCFPTGFKIFYTIITDDPRAVEKRLHSILKEMGAKRVRFQALSSARDSEWFETSKAIIEKAIIRLTKEPGFYAKRIIRLTQRSFQDIIEPMKDPILRSTVSCREIKSKKFQDFIQDKPIKQRQMLRARIQARCDPS